MDRKEQVKTFIDEISGNILSCKCEVVEREKIFMGDKYIERVTTSFEIVSEEIKGV